VVSFWARRPLPVAEVVDTIEVAGRGAIAVSSMREVTRSFHASFSATSRTYVYRVSAADLDVPRLDAMVGALVGRRCFHAFARRTPRGQTTVRHLMRARVHHDGPGRARFELHADRFLRRQVRVLVATALREMRNGAPPTALLELSLRGERAATAPPADADGLYLMGVSYC
jgi:tRNA pseudouridine(38-40) synthase